MTAPLIMIFGAAVRANGAPSAALLRRIGYGQQAAEEHPGAQVICSGGVGRVGPSEASVMIRVLRQAGIAQDRLVSDEASLDTLQSVVVAARAAAPGQPIVVCSDGYHVPRIRLMLAVLGVRSVAGPRPRHAGRGSLRHRLGMALREAAAIPYDVAIVLVRRRTLRS